MVDEGVGHAPGEGIPMHAAKLCKMHFGAGEERKAATGFEGRSNNRPRRKLRMGLGCIWFLELFSSEG